MDSPMVAFTSVLRLVVLCLAGWLLCGKCPALALQFSADLVSTPHDGGPVRSGKIYVFDGKVRIEIPEFPKSFFLIDGANDVAYFVKPAEKIFMDARQSSPLTTTLIAVDPGNPCPQWQNAAKRAGALAPGESLRCDRVDEAPGGSPSVAYRAVSKDREFFGWIAPELNFPLKLRMMDGTVVTVENIRKGPQPEHLFTIPAQFGKFDPESLIKRIKQSDVWVSEEQQ
jgi:hypothetical protein